MNLFNNLFYKIIVPEFNDPLKSHKLSKIEKCVFNFEKARTCSTRFEIRYCYYPLILQCNGGLKK